MRTNDIDRIFSRIDIPPHDPELCWSWMGYRDRDGYGRTRFDGSPKCVHRVTYEMLVGPIADGLTLDHLCRNRACVNPAHLEPATQLENYLRGVAARNHCPNGHEYTAENTATRGSRKRVCRICERTKQRTYYWRKQAEIG